MVPGKLFWPFWPSNWPYDVIGLSLEPQKSTSRLLIDRSFRWERKRMGQDFAHNSSFSSIFRLGFRLGLGLRLGFRLGFRLGLGDR